MYADDAGLNLRGASLAQMNETINKDLETLDNWLKGMAKLANIVHEHVKCDMFATNVAQFGHYVRQQIQVKKCSWHVCTCSKHFREHLLFDRMLSNLATMFANNSIQSGKSCARIMQK